MNAETSVLKPDTEVLQAMHQAGPAATCRYPGCTRPRYLGDAPNPYHCCVRHRRMLRMNQCATHAAATADVPVAVPPVPSEPIHKDSAPGQPMDPPVLNVQGVAELLGVSAGLILRLAREGKLPGKKVGSTWRFLRSSVLEWLKSSTSATRAGT